MCAFHLVTNLYQARPTDQPQRRPLSVRDTESDLCIGVGWVWLARLGMKLNCMASCTVGWIGDHYVHTTVTMVITSR